MRFAHVGYTVQGKFSLFSLMAISTHDGWGFSRCIIVTAMDCRIVGSEFELQSHRYFHFRTNTLVKFMNPFTLPAMG